MTSNKFQWSISIASNNKRRPLLLIPEYYNLYNIIGQEQGAASKSTFFEKTNYGQNEMFHSVQR